MSIEGLKFHGGTGYDVTCDECGDTDYFDDECFSWLLESMKREGWTSKRIGDEWENYCQACGEGK